MADSLLLGSGAGIKSHTKSRSQSGSGAQHALHELNRQASRQAHACRRRRSPRLHAPAVPASPRRLAHPHAPAPQSSSRGAVGRAEESGGQGAVCDPQKPPITAQASNTWTCGACPQQQLSWLHYCAPSQHVTQGAGGNTIAPARALCRPAGTLPSRLRCPPGSAAPARVMPHSPGVCCVVHRGWEATGKLRGTEQPSSGVP